MPTCGWSGQRRMVRGRRRTGPPRGAVHLPRGYVWSSGRRTVRARREALCAKTAHLSGAGFIEDTERAMMERRTLGRTGYEATILGFGAMEIRGHRIWGGRPVTDAQAERILGAALDAGINLIDTANDYGRSEEYIGRFIAHRRDEYILATKCGCTVVDAGDHDNTPHVWTRDNLLRNIDESLTRLHRPCRCAPVAQPKRGAGGARGPGGRVAGDQGGR